MSVDIDPENLIKLPAGKAQGGQIVCGQSTYIDPPAILLMLCVPGPEIEAAVERNDHDSAGLNQRLMRKLARRNYSLLRGLRSTQLHKER
jgi:hypothetical protein